MTPASAGAVVLRIGGLVLDQMLPPTCMRCDAPAGGGFQLCAACFGQCHFITAPLCARCGVPFTHERQGGPGGLCGGCLERTPRYGRARAALSYDMHSRPMILQFKYAGRTEFARLFAPMLLRAGAAMLRNADLIVPVPLHRSRLRQRGYNQAGLLCRALTRLGGIPSRLDALQRTRRTLPLSEYDAAGRAAAMREATSVRPRRRQSVAGRRIVVVDDVMTSGATADECARALLEAGALHVDILVVARVPDPGPRG